MTDTPVSTGLAGLVVEVKDVEAKLAALESAPIPALAPQTENAQGPVPVPPTPSPTPASAPPVVVAAPPVAAQMVISDEPIAAPPDAVPVPAASAVAIHSPALDALAAKEQARITQLENEKNAFYQAVLKAREQGIPPKIITQPVPPQIAEQTRLEMEAGRAAVAKAAEAQGRRIIVPPGVSTEPTMTPVFRPGDYVPDQKKGQGNVSGTSLT